MRFVLPGLAPLLAAALLCAPAARAEIPSKNVPGLEFRAGEVLVQLQPAARRALAAPAGGQAAAAGLRALFDELGVVEAVPLFRRPGAGGRAAASGAPAERVMQRFARRGIPAPAAGELPDLDGVVLLRMEEGAGAGVWEAVAELAAHPDVLVAEPNYVFRVAALPLPDEPFVPDDPYVSRDGATWSEGAFDQDFPDLHGLRTTRSIEGWNLFDGDDSGGFEAGEVRPGAGVLVAVLDSGLDRSHPDIAPNVWRNPGEIPDNGIDDDGNGFVDDVHGWDFVEDDPDPQDPHGHGTHVTGTLAARGDDARGVVGVAPWAEVMALRGLDENGSGSLSGLVRAVRYAADLGADVVSASLGAPGRSEVLAAAYDYADALGVVLVAAAGNANSDVAGFQPASFAPTIAVAATDFEDRRAPFSNFGAGVDLSAPGVQTLSLNANGGDNQLARALPERAVGDELLVLSGTSMACPHVSGAAAVLLSRLPDATPTEIRARLRVGAASIADRNPGFEKRLGAGRLDLLASLEAEPQPLIELSDRRSAAPEPGAELELVVELLNRWMPVRDLQARLVPLNPHARVDPDTAELGALGEGERVANELAPFGVRISEDTPFGERLAFDLELRGEGGFEAVLPFEFVVTYFHDAGVETGLPLDDLVPWRAVPRDYDGDGDSDLFFVGFFQSRLFRNRGGALPSFEDATLSAGILPRGFLTHEGLFADYDDDGDTDLYISGLEGGARLYLNETGETFVDVTEASAIRSGRSFTTGALDWDRDGRLDLVGGEIRNVQAARPESVFLLHGLGAGLFETATPQTCLPPNAGLDLGQLVTLDYDGDGDTDFVWAAERTPLSLYRNEGDGTFDDVTRQSGLAPFTDEGRACRTGSGQRGLGPCEFEFRRALGIAVGDYDNDGDPDLFVTGGAVTSSQLVRNDDGRFVDVTDAAGDLADDELTGMWWGNVFFDYDNDGDLDLYVTNDGRGTRAHALYTNEGDGRFSRATDLAFPGPATPGGAAATVLDLGADGALDVFAPSGFFGGGQRGALFENLVARNNGNHWLRVALRGVASPRDPFGAQVRVRAGERTLLREMRVAAIEVQPLHFGLGPAETVDLEVRWPSGIVQRLEGVAADRTLEVVEPAHCLEAGAGDPACAGVSWPAPEAERPERRVPDGRRRGREDRGGGGDDRAPVCRGVNFPTDIPAPQNRRNQLRSRPSR